MVKPKLYVLVGLPASGKSTYAKNNLLDKAKLLSSDAIRKELFNDETHQADNKAVFTTLYNRAREYLRNGDNVVIDSTSINKFERARVLRNFEGFDIEKIAIFINTPVKVCCERDLLRSRTVGKDVIYKYKRKFERPTIDEGFDNVIEVKEK